MTTSQSGDERPAQRLNALVRRAGLTLFWERLWPPIAWGGAVVALFLAASWFGLWFAAPRPARIVLLGLFVVALAATLTPLLRLRWPRRADSLARLDRDAQDEHRPASDFEDRLANGERDEATQALWTLHRARLAARVESLSLAAPAPGMTWRDPRALRFAALLLALAAGLFAGSERYARVAAAFDGRGVSAAAESARVDAWIDPPAYTGKPPLLLRIAKQERPESVVAPEGSILIVRADPRRVEARVEGALEAATPEAPPSTAGATSERRFMIHGDGKFTVLQGGSLLAAFAISATPNGKPTIALIDPPQPNLTGSLTLHYSIADAYGVTGAQALFAVPKAGSAPTRSLVEPPKLTLPLPSGRGVGEARNTSDLSEHPWAGAEVVMTLQATDVAGATGRSAPTTLTLPQRHFRKPLAKALVEQRRGLILDPDHNRPRVAEALDALMIRPDVFETSAGVFLGLGAAKSALAGARGDKDLIEVADLLWAMALQIEDGDASQALRALRAAEQKLRDALQRGASDEEIKALTQELREKAENYMRELAEQSPNANPDDMPLDAQDLESMLDRMEETARDGARDEAEAMLDQMQDMFENLKNGRTQPSSPAERELRKQLSELDKLLHDQQALRDQTFRRDQHRKQRRTPPEAAPQQGQDEDGQDSQSLEQRQQELRDRLAELQRRLKSLGLEGHKGFDDAEGAMSEAERDLKEEGQGPQEGDSPGGKGGKGKGGDGAAVEAQGRALQALREGAEGLQQQMQGGDGKDGAVTMGKRGGRNRQGGDPLGRGANGQSGAREGQLHEGPAAAERARRVLQELRRRLSDPNRSADERDYLERLLNRD